MRVASLLPSATEIVCALGARDTLVESLEILAACVHPEAFPDFQRKHRGAVVRVEPDLRCEPW